MNTCGKNVKRLISAGTISVIAMARLTSSTISLLDISSIPVSSVTTEDQTPLEIQKQRLEPKPEPLHTRNRLYIPGGGPGVSDSGFGAASGLGAVSPGISGACVTTPAAASVMLMP